MFAFKSRFVMSSYNNYHAPKNHRDNEVSTTPFSTNGRNYLPNYVTESHNSYMQSDLGHPPCSTSSDPLNQNKQGVPNLNYFGLAESDIYRREHGRSDVIGHSMAYNNHQGPHKNGSGGAPCYPSFWDEGELQNLEGHSQNHTNNVNTVSSRELYHKIPPQRHYPYPQVNPGTRLQHPALNEGGYKPKRMRVNEPNQDAHHPNIPVTIPCKPPAQKSRLCFFVHHAISPHLDSSPQHKTPKNTVKTINAHTKPINTIEWCLPQYSHLLLSTSMDSTVKIWNVFSSVDYGVQTLNHHNKAVIDAEWSISGRQILSCGYDQTARLCDVEKGTEIQCFNHPSYVTCLKYHPINHNMFMTGARNALYSWDMRLKGNPVSVYTYKEPFGQVQDLMFLHNGRELISCTDLVSRDSADRSIMAWDVRSKTVLSNQIYQERYTCTRLKCHPVDNQFIVQTNGDYLALFSMDRPYAMHKEKRFEGHKVQGYGIGFDVSMDGSKIVSGSATGDVVFYDYKTSKLITKMPSGLDVCMDTKFHPVLNSTVATCGWNGAITILQ